MDKLKIEWIDIDDLVEYKGNAKIHTPEQIRQIAKSIEIYGFNDPIAVDDNNGMIEGHGRKLALILLKRKKAPCIRLSHLTDTQKRAYIIAHNKLTMNTGFDEELLKLELDDLASDPDFDIDSIGFELEDIEKKQETREIKETKTFEEEFEETTDQNAKMPIVPEFFEKHECFIIPVHNEIDVCFVRDIFGLNENHVSKSGDGKVRKTNVISLEALRCLVK